MLIVVEGPDFAGKTTVVAELVAHLRRRHPLLRVRPSRTSLWPGAARLVEAVQASDTLPGLVKSAVFHAAYLFDLLFWRPSSEILVQESYWLRVYAHDVMRERMLGKLLFQVLGRHLPRPDLAIFLSCPGEQRRRRYLATHQYNQRDDIRFSSGARQRGRVDALLATLASRHGYHVIETDRHEPTQVASIIAGLSAPFLPGGAP